MEEKKKRPAAPDQEGGGPVGLLQDVRGHEIPDEKNSLPSDGRSKSNVAPDTDAAIAFLEYFAPGGLWTLTAINPGDGKIETRTFDALREHEARSWIVARNGRRNLYFGVNPPLRDLSKKADRADIRAVTYLHVDIDPRLGENFDEERVRILRLLTTNIPDEVPPPTFVIDSGGGYWGFWRLAQPIPINGVVEKAEDAKRYNLRLELLFGADKCHDVTRIARLPGTVNLPDKKKQAKGRVRALAKVELFEAARVHDLAVFKQAPLVVAASTTRGGGDVPKGFARRQVEVSSLPVPDFAKRVIIDGDDTLEPGKYPSRSEAMFAAVCALVRAGVDDDTIFSLLLDKDLGISGHIYDQKNSERYAARQIAQARDKVAADDGEPVAWVKRFKKSQIALAT